MGAPDVRKETLQKSIFSALGETMSERGPLEAPKGVPRDPKRHPRDTKSHPRDTQRPPKDTQKDSQGSLRAPWGTHGHPKGLPRVPQSTLGDTRADTKRTQGHPRDARTFPTDTSQVPRNTRNHPKISQTWPAIFDNVLLHNEERRWRASAYTKFLFSELATSTTRLSNNVTFPEVQVNARYLNLAAEREANQARGSPP